MSHSEKNAVSEPLSSSADLLRRARQVLDIEIEGLRALQDGLDEAFAALVNRCLAVLQRGGKLVVCGIGKSGHIGHKLAATLASTGSQAVFLHQVDAVHGDLGVLAAEDLLLALSYSGETDELLGLLPAVKRMGVSVVAITGAPDSRLAQWSDLVVPMTVPREACPFNLAPTTTTTALLALGDALAIVLLECRRFGLDDYARLHPAGAIGRSISLRVTDIMRTGERFAAVGPETPVLEALQAMTRSRCGAVAVVAADGLLMGIFTDGDFRRQVTRDAAVLTAPIRTVMTPKPIAIRSEAMAIELVKLLEERKIDDVIVVDERGCAVGLVDIQDLPRFKIM
ncbi:MAG: KpsF/GutQ family sugar-phosphate isomerase [Lentisphaerae bacterium]|nr:KpsF/GutQ family sugar-phosphate isomerase [Lentisphaerota bacterium]